jgi:hypothetical protein
MHNEIAWRVLAAPCIPLCDKTSDKHEDISNSAEHELLPSRRHQIGRCVLRENVKANGSCPVSARYWYFQQGGSEKANEDPLVEIRGFFVSAYLN